MKAIKVTTQSDIKGEREKTLLIATGNQHQAIAYCRMNDLGTTHGYRIEQVDLVDVSGIDVGDYSVRIHSLGRVSESGNPPVNFEKQKTLDDIRSKLTAKECQLLGI